MDKSPDATVSRTGPTPGLPVPEHGVLWADAPVMRVGGSGYGGRVIVEVWDDETAFSVAKDAALLPAALAALQTRTPLREALVALPSTPIMGPHNGASFLGRVIVEFWADGPVVGLFGSDSRLLDGAARHLSSLSRRPGEQKRGSVP